jgi:pimeloyl-ACP methyl ester carboxylesterase
MKLLTVLPALLFISNTACAAIPKTEKHGEAFTNTNSENPKEIIFIHGMFMTPKSFVNWERKFSQSGYKVSSPPWPLHDGSVENLRRAEHFDALGKLDLDAVVDSYRKILKMKNPKPILIGHSMGGLVAQILLSEGLAQAAIVLHSAPVKGAVALSWSFIKSNWGSINPAAKKDSPIELSFKQFAYGFVNAQERDVQEQVYRDFYVPESRRVGKGPTTDAAKIDAQKERGPLLIIAGGKDHMVPANVNYKNFNFYKNTPGYTEFELYEDRDHWTAGAAGWEIVADQVEAWINERFIRNSQ